MSRKHRANRRSGFTLVEVMVVAGITGIIAVCISVFTANLYQAWYQEMRQDQVDVNARILLTSLNADANVTYKVAYTGIGPYTTPNTSMTIPAATKLLVLQLPAYDANGTIQSAFDYVVYRFDSTASSVQVQRACDSYSGTISGTAYKSLRPSSTLSAAPGGTGITSFVVTFHVSNNSASGFPGQSIDSMDAKFTSSPPTIPLSDVDQLTFSVTCTGTTWGQSESLSLVGSSELRNWGMAGNSATPTTSPTSGTTPTTTTTATPPAAPTGLAAATVVGQVNLTWTGSTGAASYTVLRGTATGGPYSTVATGVVNPSYADTSVTNGVTYYYVVQAVNSSGQISSNSGEISATPPVPATAAPSGLAVALSASGTTGVANFSWVQSSTAGIQSNKIYQSNSTGGPYTLVTTIPAATNAQITNLTRGAAYYFVVTAVSTGGSESPFSNEASGTVP